MRVAIYARESTRDKDQNPETQLRPLREHLGGLENVQFVGEFVDTASADDLRGRRDWRRLLELVRLRRVDVIIVWRLDRAFRSVVTAPPRWRPRARAAAAFGRSKSPGSTPQPRLARPSTTSPSSGRCWRRRRCWYVSR